MTSPSSSQGSTNLFNIVKELEETKVERELAIAQLMERRRLAYKMAEEREKLNWTASGGFLTTLLSVLSSYHHKNLLHLLPVIPIAAYVGYNAHYCYGNKANVLDALAKGYLENADKASLAEISVDDIQKRVRDLKNQKAEEDLFSL